MSYVGIEGLEQEFLKGSCVKFGVNISFHMDSNAVLEASQKYGNRVNQEEISKDLGYAQAQCTKYKSKKVMRHRKVSLRD